MVRVKICGITNYEDAYAATQLGADALGFVFFQGSPRCIQAKDAQAIIAQLPMFVSAVGLFVNASAEEVLNTLAQASIDILQFHGDESPDFCRQFNRPYIKAIRVKNQQDIENAMLQFADARALLLDAHVDGVFGGTGKTFDWQTLPERWRMPWILSGGLGPHNIKDAIESTGALAVDVSSGVEQQAGQKDTEKMKKFIKGARHAGL
jgi:phosphoribosylanthranilate isomerase